MKIEMNDGSEYVVKNKTWLKAINMRIKENKDWIKQFVKQVDYHWNKKTIPTKFSDEEVWEINYENQSELAPDVAYIYLRVIIMGIALSEMTDGESKVLALNPKDGTTTEYPSGKKKKIK